MSVYDALGRRLYIKELGTLKAGVTAVKIATDELPIGVYSVGLKTPGGSRTALFVLLD